jgi:hypothetical protein
MEEQTAVEWFAYQLNLEPNGWMKDLIEQAKEKENQQNQFWWAKGWCEGHLSTLQENTETFKSE